MGFVFTLGNREDRDLAVFAEIEGRRADQVADIFNHQHIKRRQIEVIGAVADHVGVEVATGTGIDLVRRDPGGGNAIGVIGGLLVSFEDCETEFGLQGAQGRFKQGGLA